MPAVTPKFRAKRLIEVSSGTKRAECPETAPKRVHSRLRSRWGCANQPAKLRCLESSRSMPQEPPGPEESWRDLEQLYSQGLEVLAGLDRLGLSLASAHLAMALEAMRLRHPKLPPVD